MTGRPPSPTLFPYRPLFRSRLLAAHAGGGPPGRSGKAGVVGFASASAASFATFAIWPFTSTCGGALAIPAAPASAPLFSTSEKHTSELQSPNYLGLRLLPEK